MKLNINCIIAIAFSSLLFFSVPVYSSTKNHRNHAARSEFQRLNPCPSTGSMRGKCPGWIVDHIKPLACGGLDAPSNMQWQTIQDAKKKDKWELIGCRK